jgi:hypothetical protein
MSEASPDKVSETLSQKRRKKEDWSEAEVVQCLLSTCEALGSNSNTAKNQ